MLATACHVKDGRMTATLKGRALHRPCAHTMRILCTTCAVPYSEEVAAPNMQASTEAESPGPLMQGCACKQSCSSVPAGTTHCTGPMAAMMHTLKAPYHKCCFGGTSPCAYKKQGHEGCAIVTPSVIITVELQTSRSSADKHSVKWADASHTPHLPPNLNFS
jgi:hypothetical protein